ncbi:TPA: toll/interleukin-1 receptor domain-containing protein [Legionella anisa]
MSNILNNAIKVLQKRFPSATVTHKEYTSSEQITGNELYKLWFAIAQDSKSGVKQRAIILKDLGLNNELFSLAHNSNSIFNELDKGIFISIDNKIKRSEHAIDTIKMIFAPRIIIYTNKIHVSTQLILDAFSEQNLMIEIINESEMYNSLFISYGGSDEQSARKINNYLINHGVKTWFFPDDAQPGEKLHRIMHEGINKYERVLCVCSEQSLKRPGVLNELEHVFVREAKEGGSSILIPIALDDYVFSNWAPEKPDIAEQMRSRVITTIDMSDFNSENTNKQLKS